MGEDTGVSWERYNDRRRIAGCPLPEISPAERPFAIRLQHAGRTVKLSHGGWTRYSLTDHALNTPLLWIAQELLLQYEAWYSDMNQFVV